MRGRFRNMRAPLLALLAALALGGMFFVFAEPALAQADIIENIETVGEESGLSTGDPRVILAKFVRVVLGLIGIVAVGLFLYAGWLWMTSKGDPAKIEQSQKLMINAVIGMAIIFSALAITQFVLNQLTRATGAGGSSTPSSGDELIDRFSTALGAGIVDSHFPPRGARDIARNVKIVVTFREAIDPASVVDGYLADNPTAITTLQTDTVSIYPAAARNQALEGEQVAVTFTEDLKTFVFDPEPLLGNAASDTEYEVRLTSDLQLAEGGPAFVGTSADGYTWRFTVSTFVDTTPPKVTSVIPARDTTNPRNLLVQVNYNEAILPTSVTSPTTNIQLTQNNAPIAGGWSLGNQYRTSEFVSDVPCGTNSCGETMYCLPASADLEADLQAAPLGAEPPAALGPPYAGVVDMYGNSLDGNSSATAEGNPADNYSWTFSTNNAIVLDPPRVVSILPPLSGPSGPAEDVALDQPVQMLFDTILSVASLSPSSFIFHSPSESLWYSVSGDMENPDGTPVTAPTIGVDRTRVTVEHGLLSEDVFYGAEAKSSVRSVLQNCFTPSASTACVGPNCCNEDARTELCAYP